MSSADAAIGMMDGAYFVGRKDILDFFNQLLDLNLTKIEQTAPGAIACQLTELIFPGSIIMSKVNWEAKTDYEYVQNYKLLQIAFTKHHVRRHVDVDKLIRAKYQDNLEFCQWLKAFYDQAAGSAHRDDYDPAAVRDKGKGGKKYNMTHGSGKGRNNGKAYIKPKFTSAGTATTTGDRSNATATTGPLRERVSENTVKSDSSAIRSSPGLGGGGGGPAAGGGGGGGGGASDPMLADALLQKKNADLTKKVTELELVVEDLQRERDQIVMDVEKERDFYFGKLRSIEVMLQVHQEHGDNEASPENLIDRVFQILYATAEDNLTVNEQGQVVEAPPPAAEEDLEEELLSV